MQAYLRVARFIGYIRKETLIKFLIVLTMTAGSVIEAWALARCASAVLNRADMKVIMTFILVALAAILVKAFMSRINEAYSKTTAAKVKGAIRNELLEKLMKLGPKYQSTKRSGSLQSLITDGVEALESFLVYYIPQAFVCLITVIVLVVYIFRVDAVASLIVLFGVIAAIAAPLCSRSVIAKSCTHYWRNYAILNAQYIDTMQGMSTLKAFNSSIAKGEELEDNCWTFYRHQIRNTAFSIMDSSVVVLLTGIGTSVSVAVAAYGAATGRVDIAGLLGILFLVPECFKPVASLNQFWHSSYMGFSVSDQIFEILDEPISVAEKETALASGLDSSKPEINVQNVSFRYLAKREQVLKSISLDIKQGQKIALVGKSGSGKSTVVNLLLRFYDPDKGHILFNGVDICDFSLDYLRSKIAVVFQDTYLFYGTMRENLSLANPNASMEKIVEAAKAANIHDYIMSLPDGYDTIVGERGSTISGGERQRVAIARALIKDAPFLILDEATANVDAENEKSIQEALDFLMLDKTTLVIAHRLSTIRNADRIIVLENGSIAEQGTHDELLLMDNIYSRLIEAQKTAGREA